jgi:hypothetical protein
MTAGLTGGPGEEPPAHECAIQSADAPTRTDCFLARCRNESRLPLRCTRDAAYVGDRRGTEPQRARPLRCEAAPPERERRKASRGRFLKWPGTASISWAQPFGRPTAGRPLLLRVKPLDLAPHVVLGDRLAEVDVPRVEQEPDRLDAGEPRGPRIPGAGGRPYSPDRGVDHHERKGVTTRSRLRFRRSSGASRSLLGSTLM